MLQHSLAVVKVERAARKTPVGQEKNLVHFSRIQSNNFGSVNHNFSLIEHRRRIILPDGRKKETGMLLLLLFILSVLGNAASKTKPSTTEFEPPQILKEGKWQLF